jgi:hypothetical protein
MHSEYLGSILRFEQKKRLAVFLGATDADIGRNAGMRGAMIRNGYPKLRWTRMERRTKTPTAHAGTIPSRGVPFFFFFFFFFNLYNFKDKGREGRVRTSAGESSDDRWWWMSSSQCLPKLKLDGVPACV